MENDIRIKDLTNTALEMASDDYIGIDGLTNGTRKIPFSGIMDSLDPRFATTNKTPRGAIAEIKQIVDSHGNAISSIKNMISDEYDDSADYDVGDYCIYDNVRYCCNTEISGGETWNSAHWDVAKVDDDITEIKSSLSLLDFISNVQGAPASGTDLNSLKTNAIYQVGNWTIYNNPPTGIGYSGCLIVFVVRTYVLQIAYSDSGKKHRFSYNGGSSWNAWI